MADFIFITSIGLCVCFSKLRELWCNDTCTCIPTTRETCMYTCIYTYIICILSIKTCWWTSVSPMIVVHVCYHVWVIHCLYSHRMCMGSVCQASQLSTTVVCVHTYASSWRKFPNCTSYMCSPWPLRTMLLPLLIYWTPRNICSVIESSHETSSLIQDLKHWDSSTLWLHVHTCTCMYVYVESVHVCTCIFTCSGQ